LLTLQIIYAAATTSGNRGASLLGENSRKDNAWQTGGFVWERGVHSVLYSWRDDLSCAFVRALAVFCGLLAVSLFATWLYEMPAAKSAARPAPKSDWVEVERPFPAFELSIPEASGEPASYAIRRHALGGRKDILTLGTRDGTTPFLQIEVYRPGDELAAFRETPAEITWRAAALSSGSVTVTAFGRNYDESRMQIFGFFCQGGAEYVTRAMLGCAIDRFSLLAAGSEPKVTALFAQAELRRSFCGQRSPLLAATPQHRALWRAMAENERR